MHKPSIDKLVHRYLFPNPKPSDPTDFHDFVRKHIVPEVRHEIIRYYGSVGCLESQYPGLDYSSNRGHRLRLSQFKWHRRLFSAFDDLRLTRGEVYMLCKWEGTKWAKDKYQRDHDCVIRDTTWDGIPAVEPRRPLTVTRGIYVEGKNGNLVQTRSGYGSKHPICRMDLDGHADEESEQDSTDEFMARTMGTALRRHLRPRPVSQYTSNQGGMDPAWDQWLKDATERGTIPSMSELGSSSRLAAYQAHIPAHYAFATPIYHYGPYSPAQPTFSPTTTTYHQPPMPLPIPYPGPYPLSSYSARSSRHHRARTFR